MSLRDLRLAAGLSQARLAAAMGVSAAYLSMVETGARALTARRAVGVGRALGLGGDDLALCVGRLVLWDEGRGAEIKQRRILRG